MKEYYSVAIDGPSGAGKSTVARRIAGEFGFLYVDTGAIYRTVGLAVLREGISSKDEAAIAALLPKLSISLRYGDDGLQHMFLFDEDVTGLIRTPQISQYASDVSAFPVVRAYLMETQRSLARNKNVIMDGRDIGTVVLPDAGLKIFLTASPESRARRRMLELQEKGQKVDYEEILAAIEQRDRNDSTRETAPLKPADDAVFLDTTYLDLEQSCQAAAKLVRERFDL